jgi:hypothetical protein
MCVGPNWQLRRRATWLLVLPIERGSIMLTLTKRVVLTAAVVGAVCGFGPSADAQQVKGVANVQRIYPVNTNPYIAPGVTLQQYAYNTAVLGRLYSQVPAALLGYNNPYGVYGAGYNPAAFTPAVYSPLGAGYGGYPGGGGYGIGNPYVGGGYGPGGIDPLTGIPGGGYSSLNNPYWNPYGGGYMYSSAADIQAYAQLGISQEQARILRESANQAKLVTRKMTADLEAYLREKKYTFTKEQADIAKQLLERVQVTPTNTEITTGKSLNILLQDLGRGKFDSKNLMSQTVTIDEDVLKLLNVTGAKDNDSNLALLRNDGQVTWTLVFDDTTILPKKTREDIDSYAKQLFFQAANANGTLDKNTLKDLESALRKLRDDLRARVNKVDGQDYRDGLRFLDTFDAAVRALRLGDATVYLDFNQKFAKGGKTVQELVDYMTSKGLVFAPSIPGDERAYQAIQAALAVHSLALHAQLAANKQQ